MRFFNSASKYANCDFKMRFNSPKSILDIRPGGFSSSWWRVMRVPRRKDNHIIAIDANHEIVAAVTAVKFFIPIRSLRDMLFNLIGHTIGTGNR